MQFTRSKKIIGGLALVGAMALTGVTGFAQGQTQTPNQSDSPQTGRGYHHRGGKGMHGGHGMFGRFGAQLNLTEAQKQQMQQIAARYKETFKAMREQRKAERGGGFDALTDGTFNEAAVRAEAQARANAQVEMHVARARMMSEMYAVLTPEQKAQITAARQQREQRRQQRRLQRQSSQTQSL